MDHVHKKAWDRIWLLQERGEEARAARLERLLVQVDDVLSDFEEWPAEKT